MVSDDTGRMLGTIAVVTLVVLAGCAGGIGLDGASNGGDANGDDVAANGNGANGNDAAGNGNAANGEEGLGYTPGGAQDVNNFRDNVESDTLPIRSDVTHEGVFSDYYFESDPGECEQLFCPAYSRAVTDDPLSNETEKYLSVGLNSNLNASEFERERLNLVVVLDTSGSMGQSMDRYHSDGRNAEGAAEVKPKIDAATDATTTLLDQLGDDDRFGLVTFDGTARTEVPLERLGDRDEGQLREDIGSIRADGGTNLAAGMDEARQQVDALEEDDAETRVVYLTDAQPNEGDTTATGFETRIENDAEDEVYSTFVGVGMDFNSELVDSITSVRGANYYAVDSAERFEQRMGEEFEYMVTPLVFDLELELESDAYEIGAVYGSPQADATTGELMSVKTLFPSPTENGSTKGGVVMVELDETGANGADDGNGTDNGNATLDLTASYEDRDGEGYENTETLSVEAEGSEHFDDTATRKAVALARYATLMGNWIDHERALLADEEPGEPAEGIESSSGPDLGTWERQSTDLRVSPPYGERIRTFASDFADEVDAVGDETMAQELDTMETILETSDVEFDAENATESTSDDTEIGNESTSGDTGTGDETSDGTNGEMNDGTNGGLAAETTGVPASDDEASRTGVVG